MTQRIQQPKNNLRIAATQCLSLSLVATPKIQQVNGIDLWYVGLKNTNIKLYDYIEKGKLLGEVDTNEIYLFYQKEGKFIDYQEYLG